LELRQFQDRPAVRSPADIPEFFGGGQKFRFDLYRIPFNGGAGGEPVPLEGASHNGKSNYFPRFSPDGKWLVFCQADSFMLLQHDANLFIMPAAGGTPRKLRANRDSMNSWHSWSSNSRWLVFTSKLNGPYSQLFLTHIDAEGNDSPPVLLENFTAPDRAANIPEFVALPSDRIKKIEVGFLSADSYYQGALAVMSLAQEKGKPEDLEKAAILFSTAVDLDPENAKMRTEYGMVLVTLGRQAEAAEQWHEAIRLRPEDPEPYYNLGLMAERAGEVEEADRNYLKASILNPDFVEARLALLLIRLKKGQVKEAIQELETIVAMKPDWYPALFYLGTLKMDGGQMEEARDLLRRAVAANPQMPEAHWRLGVTQLALGKAAEALAGLDEAVRLFPGDPNLMDLLAIAMAATGSFQEAELWSSRALESAKAKNRGPLIKAIEGHLNDIRARKVPGL
jgi:tetratricopeptide (TPR) repeat protein